MKTNDEKQNGNSLEGYRKNRFIRFYFEKTGLHAAVLEIKLNKPLPFAFSITNKKNFPETDFLSPSLITGDYLFDKAYHIQISNDELYGLALFNISIRNTLFEMAPQLTWLKGHEKKIRLGISGTSIEPAAALIDTALYLADLMTYEINPEEALILNIEASESGVRKRCLPVLLNRFERNNRITALLRELTHDFNPEIKYRAARALGKEGLSTLHEILEDEDNPFQEKAMHILVSLGETEIIRRFLHRFDKYSRKIQILILDELAIRGFAEASEFLTGLLNREEELKIKAMAALETCGKLEAVEPLYNFTRKLSLNVRLKNAAIRALRAIQYREANGERGELSLTSIPPEAGALSKTQSHTGSVSHSPAPPSRET